MSHVEPPVDPDYFRLGWVFWLPPRSLFLHAAIRFADVRGLLGDLDDLMRVEEVEHIVNAGDGCGLDDAAYFRIDATTSDALIDEEIRQLDHRARVQRASDAAGMVKVETNRQAFELLRRLGILHWVFYGESVRWTACRPLPLPEERIVLSREEEIACINWRWNQLHWPAASRILSLFDTWRLERLKGSLLEWSALVSADPEEVRHGILALVEARTDEFIVIPELERLLPSEPFMLVRLEGMVALGACLVTNSSFKELTRLVNEFEADNPWQEEFSRQATEVAAFIHRRCGATRYPHELIRTPPSARRAYLSPISLLPSRSKIRVTGRILFVHREYEHELASLTRVWDRAHYRRLVRPMRHGQEICWYLVPATLAARMGRYRRRYSSESSPTRGRT